MRTTICGLQREEPEPDYVRWYVNSWLQDQHMRGHILYAAELPAGRLVKVNSITNQRDMIMRYIRDNKEFSDYLIKEYLDDGFTGRNFEREGFQNLIMACKQGSVQCIIVKDFS